MNASSSRALWRLRLYTLAVLTFCLLPLLFLYIPYRALIKKKPMTGFWRKLCGSNSKPPEKGMVLVHGVSMGEVNLMRPVIPLLEEALQKSCMLSSSTDTGWKSLEKHFSDRHICFYPLDVPWAVWRFLTQQRPSLIILLELEVWPLFLAACFSRGIPVAILNARIGDKSFAGYKRFGWFWRPIFKSLHCAIAQNTLWADRLTELGVPQVKIGKSLKADVVQLASSEDINTERQRLQLDERPVVLAASTGEHEELVLLKSFKQWTQEKQWRIIVCPRHPERGPAIKALAEQHGLEAVCTSSMPDAPDIQSSQLIIVDEIGRLSALYGIAEIAVVGGSIGSGRHGQNMLEAAAAGTCCVVGWDTSNQPDAMALLREYQGVIECSDADDLHTKLLALVADPERRQQLGEAGAAAWQSSRGAAERSVKLLAECLNSN